MSCRYCPRCRGDLPGGRLGRSIYMHSMGSGSGLWRTVSSAAVIDGLKIFGYLKRKEAAGVLGHCLEVMMP